MSLSKRQLPEGGRGVCVCHCQRESYLKGVGCVCVSLSKRELPEGGRMCLCVHHCY